MKKKKKKWMRFRHRIVRNLAFAIIYPYSRLVYGIKIERLKEQHKRQYLLLYNHQTPFDQFFVGMALKNSKIYYLATEDIFSKSFVSKLIKFLVAPIPIKKQTTDVRAVMNCISVVREGGSICLAPEGNRTYSGKTEYINPAIAMMAQKLKLPIGIFKIEGGYGVHPRWSDFTRRGKMTGHFSRILEPEEYKDMSAEELNAVICRELYVNDPENAVGEFRHKNCANYLERAFYVCPKCGLTCFESEGSKVQCKKCGLSANYLPNLKFTSDFPEFTFNNTNDWYEYQNEFVRKLDTSPYLDKHMFTDTANMFEVIVYKNKNLICENASVSLYADRITVNETVFPFEEITAMSVLGKNKCNIYHGGKVYQLKSHKRFNALKYVNIYYLYKNIEKDGVNGKFLGL